MGTINFRIYIFGGVAIAARGRHHCVPNSFRIAVLAGLNCGFEEFSPFELAVALVKRPPAVETAGGRYADSAERGDMAVDGAGAHANAFCRYVELAQFVGDAVPIAEMP